MVRLGSSICDTVILPRTHSHVNMERKEEGRGHTSTGNRRKTAVREQRAYELNERFNPCVSEAAQKAEGWPRAEPNWFRRPGPARSGEDGFVSSAARLRLRRDWVWRIHSEATPHPEAAPRPGAPCGQDDSLVTAVKYTSSIFLGHMNPSWDGEGTPEVSGNPH